MSNSCLVSAWNSCFVTLESSSVAADVEHNAAENADGLKLRASSDLGGRLKAEVMAEAHLRLCASLQVETKRVTFISFPGKSRPRSPDENS